MTQRKLTDDELEDVLIARKVLRRTNRFASHTIPVCHALDVLDEMAREATTDGQPYVDPEPPIPDGYREVTAGDERRADCKFWSAGGMWKQRSFVGRELDEGVQYIVPVDVTPTDEEAKSRPTIMVRDCESHSWTKATLYGVRSDDGGYWYIAVLSHGLLGCWKYARHLYPGE